jgi:biopolymer transport protein ExbB
MTLLSSLFAQLGVLETPLLICSFIASVIVLERLIILSRFTITGYLISNGRALIESLARHEKDIRSEIASLWLVKKQKKLSAGLRILYIVIVIAPLLGLLGTVLGLVKTFRDIGQLSGPVEVSTLADGLGIAMSTTAVGLLIAIPALVIYHLYQLWLSRLIDQAEVVMNQANLSLEGLDDKMLMS